MFELRGKEPEDLFTVMLKGYKRRSLTGCSIKPDPNVHEAKTEMGLVMGHAYTISKVDEIQIQIQIQIQICTNIKGGES